MSDVSAISRRAVLKGVGAFGATAAIGSVVSVTGNSAYAENALGAHAAEGEGGVQYGFLMRAENCVNCGNCVEACRRHNKTPDYLESRRKVTLYESEFGKRIYLSTSCMHCAKPSCMTVCPARAIAKRPDGIVTVNGNLCIGCKYCFQACPFGVPHYGSEGMDKCDCCLEAGVPAGEEPNCVKACLFGALEYGPLDELEGKTHGTAKRVITSTEPSYLVV